MIAATILMIAGLSMLYFGAVGLVRGSSNLGLRLGISPLVVGLTIVAFGTSAPELAVSVNAAHLGKTDVSIANVIGSNIANIGLILGISALVHPIKIDVKLIRIDIPIMIATTLFMCFLLVDSTISRVDGMLLISGIVAFTIFNIVKAREAKPVNHETYKANLPKLNNGPFKDIVFIIAGLVLLTVGGNYFVEGAVNIARLVGISEVVIGLTIIAVGTSLPELATSVMAAAKNMSEISVGNIVGSNIFNILSVLGLSSLLEPLPLGNVRWVDVAIMVIFTLAVLPLARSEYTLSRKEGFIFLAGYIGYIGWLIKTAI
jgi:cation:H+ antiporter